MKTVKTITHIFIPLFIGLLLVAPLQGINLLGLLDLYCLLWISL